MRTIIALLASSLLALFLCRPAHADTWAVYWYVCGSDLERRMGGASLDIEEALAASLPDEVTVVMQTGGTREWQTEGIDSDKLGRFTLRNGRMKRLATLPQASMGKASTLADFLKFCMERYPADHRVLIIWDHGGGSARELANDENFDGQGLSLGDLRRALDTALENNAKAPPLEIIGFDACLMATLDVANVLHGFARYMVASEDLEPGNGWEYTGWLNALGKKTSMDGLELGRRMCDTYLAGCREAETDANATLSVTDLERLPMLNAAWNALGMEAIATLADNDAFFADMARQANRAENYMNSKAQGFTNMVDMGSYVGLLRGHLPQFSDTLLESLRSAVPYHVNGRYRKSSGLSFYYPLDGGQTFKAMQKHGYMSSFLLIHGLQLGEIDEDTALARLEVLQKELASFQPPEEEGAATAQAQPQQPQAQQIPIPSLPQPAHQAEQQGGLGAFASILANGTSALQAGLAPLERLDISSLEDTPIEIDDKGDATLDLGRDKIRYLSSVIFHLAYYDIKGDIIIFLGSDADIDADWEAGVFKDNFRNTWPTLDGHLLHLELTHQDEDIYRYAVPAKLNGERVNLDIIYDFSEEAYKLIGARRMMKNGIPDKFLIKLKPGDSITTIFPAMTIEGDEKDSTDVDSDTFSLTASPSIKDEDMGDGSFIYLFEMRDVQGNSATSQVATIDVKNGEISMGKPGE